MVDKNLIGIDYEFQQAASDELESITQRVETLESSPGGGGGSAIDITYDNSDTGFVTDNVQGFIEEVDGVLETLAAEDISFNNSGTNLTSTNVQTAIAEIDSTKRIKLEGSIKNFYVSTTGSNGNDGETLGTPWATLPFALQYIAEFYDLGDTAVVINLEDGTYTLNSVIFPAFVSTSDNFGCVVEIRGNATNPENVILGFSNPGSLFAIRNSNDIRVCLGGFTIRSQPGNSPIGLNIDNSRDLEILNPIRFEGDFSYCVFVNNYSFLQTNDSFIFDTANVNGLVRVSNSSTITVFSDYEIPSGTTVNVGDATFTIFNNSSYIVGGNFNWVVNGSVSGKRFDITGSFVDLTNVFGVGVNPSPTYFPGDITGTFAERLYGDINYDNSASGLTATSLQDAIDELTTGDLTQLPGPFADDTAASGGGVIVGQLYYTAAGDVRIRLA